MKSQINIAEGHKQTVIFDGQGGAEQIILEAKALVEAIKQIGDAMIDENGNINQNALKIRITENYLDTISNIYKEVKIVGLPESNGSDSSNPLSPENIATAMIMFKQVTGKESIGDLSTSDIQNIQSQIGSLKKGLDEVNRGGSGSQRSGNSYDDDSVRYLDSQTLY